ncbi:DNA/RNA non-specific endonuclease [Croceiramulus getboli]|nr:DNA/RNA non-specific endonuclease [Flavobacteriaceae bacterium YJPT1-3]
MSRKYLYPLFMLIAVLLIYWAERYLDQRERQPLIEEGKILKSTTHTTWLPSSTTGQIVHHEYYSLSYSEPHEQAEWVAYELRREHLSDEDRKRPYFEVDLAVPSGAAHWRNYKNSGYDRGHLCPAGDRRFSKEAYDETFLTSNISPQRNDFNAGIWNRLEIQTRRWARKYKKLFVVTGGVLTGGLEEIGEEGVDVPEQYYKIILNPQESNPRMVAFLIDHQESNQPLSAFVVSVDEIEELTGIDFFAQMDDDLEQQLERSSTYWK